VLASGSTTYRQRVDGGRNPAAGVKRAYFIYEPPDTSGDQHALGEQARLQTDRRVVEVTVRWIESPHSTAAGLPRLSGEGGRVIIIQRVIPAASAKDSTGALEESESDSIATRVQNAIDDYMSKRLVEPGWEKFAQGWTTPVCEDMAAGAESISGLHDQLHQLILGKTVESLTGLEPISNIAAEFALPGDTWLTTAKLLVEGIGIGIGLASGQPLLVNACMKALTHDAALKAVSKGIGGLLTETLDPADTREQDAAPAQDEFARHVQELGDDIEDQSELESSNYLIQIDYLEDQAALDMPDTLLRLQEHRDLNDTQASGWDATPDNGYTVQEHRSNNSQDHPRDYAEGRE
jgi:hypothetical protein